MRTITAFLAVIATALFITSQSQAQGTVEIGTLTCTGGEGIGLILGSNKTFDCVFASNDGRLNESYEARLSKIGLDIGVTGKTVMIWTVLAATQSARPGMLTGGYVGATADAAVGVGGGAKLLVGGSSNSITLQPLSVQGQSGVNLAVGIASMSLRRPTPQ